MSVTSLSEFETQYATSLMTLDEKCITLIVPGENCGHFESNALIVQDKMESGGQSKKRKPSRAAVAFNRTVKCDGP